jgi:hypothetical protein
VGISGISGDRRGDSIDYFIGEREQRDTPSVVKEATGIDGAMAEGTSRDNMIDPAEANETYRAASAIAAFDAIQVAFAALVKKGILSKVEAEQILRQAIETIKTGGAGDQAAELLAIALEKISKFEPAPRQ